MPLLPEPEYKAKFPFTNPHIQTLLPPLFRKVDIVTAPRERIRTQDNDFLDIDWLYAESEQAKSVVVLSHGLEGHSKRKYIRAMARCMNQQGWDVAAWNFRGCSGDMNLQPHTYHSGQTEDLHTVVLRCVEKGYKRVALAGFSMGGNQICKYLGEVPEKVPEQVVAAATFSVPCDLTGASMELAKPVNTIYMLYFMRSLKEKVRMKHTQFPDMFPLEGLDTMTTFSEFDSAYTAPVNGFIDCWDYWEKCGCGQFLDDVNVPCLIANAKDDPFLSASCYPYEQAGRNEKLFLEVPVHGGHVGFVEKNAGGYYWSDLRAVSFLHSYLEEAHEKP